MKKLTYLISIIILFSFTACNKEYQEREFIHQTKKERKKLNSISKNVFYQQVQNRRFKGFKLYVKMKGYLITLYCNNNWNQVKVFFKDLTGKKDTIQIETEHPYKKIKRIKNYTLRRDCWSSNKMCKKKGVFKRAKKLLDIAFKHTHFFKYLNHHYNNLNILSGWK